MSGNLLASSLLASHAPVSREPQIPQSEARGQGAGFESLLAEFDPTNASASAARGDNGSGPHVGRGAALSDPGALGTSRGTLGANIDAALSSLATVASRAPGQARPAAAARTAATAARAAPSADPSAPTTSRGTLLADIDAALSSPAAGASTARAPTSAIASVKTATPAPNAPTTTRVAPAADLDAAASSMATGVSPAAGRSAPIVAAKTAASATRAAPSADSSGSTKSRPAENANIDAASFALGTSAPLASALAAPFAVAGSAAPMIASGKASTTPARQTVGRNEAPALAATAESASVGTMPNAAPAAEIVGGGLASPTAVSTMPSIFENETVSPAATSWPSGSEANPSLVDFGSFLSAAIARAGAGFPREPAPVTQSATPAPGAALGEIAYATRIAVSFAPELGFQGLQTKTHLAVASVANAVGATGRGSGQAISAAAANAALRAQADPRSEGSSFPGLDGNSPGAVLGAASDATQLALSPALDPGFPGSQTKPRLALPSVASADRPASARAEAAPDAAAPSTPNAAPSAQANPREERSSSPRPGRDDSTGAAPQAVSAKAPEATPTMVAAVSPSPAAPSSANANAVDLSDLGARLANEAQSLGKSESDTNAGAAAVPIKELHLDLQPANLGAVAVRLKMTGGKLSVDVGVANPNALAAVESQRDAIISRLQAGTQPLESFVVHQQASAAPFSSQSSSNPSPAESSGNTSGHEQSSPDNREQTPRQPRTSTRDDAQPARDGLRAGLVV